MTHTSLGLKHVREVLFTEANGARPLSLGVPRVLVVLTDGQVPPSFLKTKKIIFKRAGG